MESKCLQNSRSEPPGFELWSAYCSRPLLHSDPLVMVECNPTLAARGLVGMPVGMPAWHAHGRARTCRVASPPACRARHAHGCGCYISCPESAIPWACPWTCAAFGHPVGEVYSYPNPNLNPNPTSNPYTPHLPHIPTLGLTGSYARPCS